MFQRTRHSNGQAPDKYFYQYLFHKTDHFMCIYTICFFSLVHFTPVSLIGTKFHVHFILCNNVYQHVNGQCMHLLHVPKTKQRFQCHSTLAHFNMSTVNHCHSSIVIATRHHHIKGRTCVDYQYNNKHHDE